MPEWIAIPLLIVGAAAALASFPGTVELFLLTLGGLLPSGKRRMASAPPNIRLAIVIPAHNEELGLPQCLSSLRAGGARDGEVVVIADNCSDKTATVAAAHGARVLERHNLEQRGKGYALDYAFRILLPEPFDAFLIVDADTDAPLHFLPAMRARFAAGAAAVQCRYLVRNPEGSIRTRLMNLALLAFNAFRPRGRERWGLSVGILGNGFGLARRVLEAVPYEASSVVEDLEYHIRLVSAGFRVQFVEETCVYGEMPVAGAGVKTQRARWEGGRLRMLREHTPRLAARVLTGEVRLFEPLLELLLLPLAMHVALLLVSLIAPSGLVRGYAGVGLGLVALHLLGAIWRSGGTWRDLAAIAAAPAYVLWKVIMIPSVLRNSRANSTWVRTERPASGEPR